EQNHDDNGIIWPMALAPFELVITPLNYEKSERVRDYTDNLYQQLVDAGVDVLLDDRPLRPGNKFADAELMGLPHRLVIGERGLDTGNLEYRDRRASENEDLP
ncbi:MAG TPA: proline--tRNA ligase, partial [Oceanospirillaceae bacterium]|nr:proline--tRNA ligase [Oceanospirillaceae bacterium]